MDVFTIILEEIDDFILKLIMICGKSKKRLEVVKYLEIEKGTTARILENKVQMKERAVYNLLHELAEIGYIRFEKRQNATRYVSIIILNYKNSFRVDYQKILEEHNKLLTEEKERLKPQFPIFVFAGIKFKLSKDKPFTLYTKNLTIEVPEEYTKTPEALEKYVIENLNVLTPKKKRKPTYNKEQWQEMQQQIKQHEEYLKEVKMRKETKKEMEDSNCQV